mmetsp:Transcript_55943/g.155990  ORF Transcript_55943/g.155990 Transcript_55943/m.155990 type:complete len:284 (+) Transcript_55943:95-946(+)
MRPRASVLALAALWTASAQVPQPDGLPEDMECAHGPNAATWLNVKQRMRGLFEDNSGLFQLARRADIKAVLDGSMQEVTAVGGFAPGAGAECGFGRILLQMLNIMLVEDPALAAQVFRSAEVLSSPVLTVLLDVPWVHVALSGWPFFAVLAQVALHKVDVLKNLVDNDMVDGLQNDEATKAYFAQLASAQMTNDIASMAAATVTYLDGPSKENIFGPLTAMAAQSAVQPGAQERLELLHGMQKAMRNIIRTVSDLEVALTIRWPLWGLLHVGVDAFAVTGGDA